MKMPPYSLQSILDSHRWLGHQGFTELNAIHRDYRPGAENYDWNSKRELFPKIRYATSEGEVLQFVKEFHAHHMVCYGLNPRSRVFRGAAFTGHPSAPRSAKEADIEVSQNLVFDFDFESKETTADQLYDLQIFLQKSEEYFLDLHLRPPAKAFTGRGFHLLFAFPEIKVAECGDIGARCKRFRDDYWDAYRHELAHLKARLDSTQDLRRMVRIYGTAKPDIGIISKFYGKERVEDERLRAYLLEQQSDDATAERNFVLRSAAEIPPWFSALLETDRRVHDLWAGTGKQEGDRSRSGYDYSLILRLMRLGHRNLDELASILVLRPDGSVQKSSKGDAYVRRTLANALLRPSSLGEARTETDVATH